MTLKNRILGSTLSLVLLLPLTVAPTLAIDFGNNTSDTANDGECDDPRFTGYGMADTLLAEDAYSDASDCRSLFNSGQIRWR